MVKPIRTNFIVECMPTILFIAYHPKATGCAHGPFF